MDTGLLILRVVFGLLMIGHGTQKLFGWFGGPGPHKAAGFVASRGFAPAMFWTVSGSVSETVGGLFLLLGFLSPLGSIAIAGDAYGDWRVPLAQVLGGGGRIRT